MRFLFEDYALDTDLRELQRGTVVVSVTPQAFDLLDYLIRNRGRVVSKEELFTEIDRSLKLGRVERDEGKAAEGAEWLQKIEDENAEEMTPERMAAMEAAAASEQAMAEGDALPMAGAPKTERKRLGEDVSPTAGRRFTRA